MKKEQICKFLKLNFTFFSYNSPVLIITYRQNHDRKNNKRDFLRPRCQKSKAVSQRSRDYTSSREQVFRHEP